jgi:hypothetical protein
MDEENFIYNTTKGGKITSGGYSINSKILQGGMPAISTVEMQKGGGMQSLAVPAGLFLLQQSIKSKTNALDNVVVSEPEVIGDDLYDRLLSLVDPYEKKVVKKKRKTRRVKKNGNKRKTRKSK